MLVRGVRGYVVGVRPDSLNPRPRSLNPNPQAPKQQDEFTFFSNYGVQSVELVAPGQNIISNLGWLQDSYRGLNNYRYHFGGSLS